MKKVCSLFLTIALIICMLPVYASADEVQLVNISIVHKQGESAAVRKNLAVIKSGEDLLFSGEDLAELGGFDYRIEKGKAYFTRGVKKVRVDLKASYMYPYDDHPGGSRYVFKEAVQQIDGVYYFPGTEILPWLNVTCFLHEDVLNIYTDSVSIWELVPEFTPEDFAFDFTACCKELGVSGKNLKARAYFQNEGISGVFFDMIPTIGEYLDYYELFDDVVQDLTAAEEAMKEFQEDAEDASYWMEIAEDADVVGELPDVFRVTGEVAKVFANNAVGFAFDMARYVKYFYTHNDTVLAALFSMELNSDLYGLPDTASAALVEIRENYSDYYAGIENKMMIAIGETALDGLVDTATGLYKFVVKLMGFAEATSPDWAEGVNRISSYDTIAAYCRRGYEKEINGTWISSVQDIRGLAYMYLYSCEQNWTAMKKYATKQGNLELAAKYEAKAKAAEEWQAKFLETAPAEQNDSHEYGEVTKLAKQEYTDRLREMFAELEYTEESKSISKGYIGYIGRDISEVVNDLGNDYVDEYWDGGHCYTYNDLGICFFFDDTYRFSATQVFSVYAWQDRDYGYGLSAQMTYPELVEAVAMFNTDTIPEPEGYHLYEDTSLPYIYSTQFVLDGLRYFIKWDDDPKANDSFLMSVSIPYTADENQAGDDADKSDDGNDVQLPLTEAEAYDLACTYWGYSEEDPDLYVIVKHNVEESGGLYYVYTLNWMVYSEDGSAGHLSTIDWLYINSETGECSDSL